MKQFLAILIVALLITACVPKVENQNEPAEPQPETPVVAQPETSILDAVYESARLLGIEERFVNVTEDDGVTVVRLPMSGDEMELALAASVFEGQFELARGDVRNSTMRGAAWVIEAKGPDGRTIRVTLGGGTPLAIVVDDFGTITSAKLQAFCRETPPEVTFAIIPGTPYAIEAMELGRDTGHELMIHMPMQAMSAAATTTEQDLTVDMTASQIRQRVQGWIKELPLCVGANNHQGSKFTADADAMEPVIEVLRENGFYFIDSRTYKDTQAYKVALRMGVPAGERRCFLDVPDVSDGNIDNKIAELNKLRDRGIPLIAISHCFPEAKLAYLKKFIERAESEGYMLVPASQVVGVALP